MSPPSIINEHSLSDESSSTNAYTLPHNFQASSLNITKVLLPREEDEGQHTVWPSWAVALTTVGAVVVLIVVMSGALLCIAYLTKDR